MSRAADSHWSFSNKKGEPEIELTHNWDQEDAYSGGRNFGHLAYAVDDIYATCSRLRAQGVTILPTPRDGHGLCSVPDQISVELLQRDGALGQLSHGYRCRTRASGRDHVDRGSSG